MTALHTAESLAAMTGVELVEVMAGCMGWRNDGNGLWMDANYSLRWIGTIEGTPPITCGFRPDYNHNHAAEAMKWLADKYPNYGWEYHQVNLVGGQRLHEWVFWGGDELKEWQVSDVSSTIAICRVFIQAAEALGGGSVAVKKLTIMIYPVPALRWKRAFRFIEIIGTHQEEEAYNKRWKMYQRRYARGAK